MYIIHHKQAADNFPAALVMIFKRGKQVIAEVSFSPVLIPNVRENAIKQRGVIPA